MDSRNNNNTYFLSLITYDGGDTIRKHRVAVTYREESSSSSKYAYLKSAIRFQNHQVNRRMSVECTGVPNPVDTKFEKELGYQLWKEKKKWEEIEKIDYIEN